MSFITTKFHEILLSAVLKELRWQKNRTDWLTDRLTDVRVKNIIPSATRCVGIINLINLRNAYKVLLSCGIKNLIDLTQTNKLKKSHAAYNDLH